MSRTSTDYYEALKLFTNIHPKFTVSLALTRENDCVEAVITDRFSSSLRTKVRGHPVKDVDIATQRCVAEVYKWFFTKSWALMQGLSLPGPAVSQVNPYAEVVRMLEGNTYFHEVLREQRRRL